MPHVSCNFDRNNVFLAASDARKIELNFNVIMLFIRPLLQEAEPDLDSFQDQ